MQTEVDSATWDRIAVKLRQSTVRKPDGGELRKAYGAFQLSRATLYRGNGGLDAFPVCRVVLEWSSPKVLHGHNVRGSELCAWAAMDLVLDELEGVTGVSLHAKTFLVCRLDVAYTFVGVPAAPYLMEAARYTLPRRERVIYEHGVGFRSQIRSELLYDKRAEVTSAVAKLADDDARTEDGELRPLADLVSALSDAQPSSNGLPADSAGLVAAASLVADGALRVEVRVKGSANVARALGLAVPGTKPRSFLPATFERVIRDESTYQLLSEFLAQFNFGSGPATPDTIARLRADGHSGSRLLQLLGFRQLELLVGADREAYQALGLSPARRRSLRRDLHVSGMHGFGGAALRPLFVSREMLAAIREIDARETESWQTRRTVWRNFWGLQPREWGLLAA